MLLMVSCPGLDWDSEIVQTIKSYGYEVRHYKIEDDTTSFYFDHPQTLVDVVVMGSKDAVPYMGFYEELSKLLKKKKGITVYTIEDNEAAKETAIVDYNGDDVFLRLELPNGTLYDGPTEFPVKMIMKNTIKNILKKAGYTVHTASDGKSAMNKADNKLPSLILLDYLTASEEIFVFCRQLKQAKKTKDIPVLVLTNFAGKEEEIEKMHFDKTKYLIKTNYTPRQLVELIKKELKIK